MSKKKQKDQQTPEERKQMLRSEFAKAMAASPGSPERQELDRMIDQECNDMIDLMSKAVDSWVATLEEGTQFTVKDVLERQLGFIIREIAGLKVLLRLGLEDEGMTKAEAIAGAMAERGGPIGEA